ncbi:hypothetical protein AK812_SmicGene26055 [Symbiodinium microadriaticum]|uniref:Uncharacterized protein n=1 Tax=Symbiodinium microadriaticum TaxID=2951 RepID=A0A1Q9DAD6_SYMMI|nr:hypothetical protein AK812_SmicGene26055 [Symbiodinium microadriaticum]
MGDEQGRDADELSDKRLRVGRGGAPDLLHSPQLRCNSGYVARLRIYYAQSDAGGVSCTWVWGACTSGDGANQRGIATQREAQGRRTGDTACATRSLLPASICKELVQSWGGASGTKLRLEGELQESGSERTLRRNGDEATSAENPCCLGGVAFMATDAERLPWVPQRQRQGCPPRGLPQGAGRHERAGLGGKEPQSLLRPQKFRVGNTLAPFRDIDGGAIASGSGRTVDVKYPKERWRK